MLGEAAGITSTSIVNTNTHRSTAASIPNSLATLRFGLASFFSNLFHTSIDRKLPIIPTIQMIKVSGYSKTQWIRFSIFRSCFEASFSTACCYLFCFTLIIYCHLVRIRSCTYVSVKYLITVAYTIKTMSLMFLNVPSCCLMLIWVLLSLLCWNPKL